MNRKWTTSILLILGAMVVSGCGISKETMIAYNEPKDAFHLATLAGAKQCAPCEYATAEAYLAYVDQKQTGFFGPGDEISGPLKNAMTVTREKSLEAIRICQRSPAAPISRTEWLKLVVALEYLKDWQGMLDWCQKWTKSDPDDTIAWYNLGVAYGNLKRYDDAIEAYREALRIDPEDPNAWYNLGIAYALSGNRTAAMDAVQKLRRLDPARADELLNLIVPR